MEDQKTVFIPLSKYVTSSKQLTHEEEEGSVIKYFWDNDFAGQWNMLVIICLDLSSWH